MLSALLKSFNPFVAIFQYEMIGHSLKRNKTKLKQESELVNGLHQRNNI